MSTITKERLEWLSNISGRDDIDDIDGVEIRELARIALASLEAEAVSVFKIDHESSLIKHVKKVVSETNAPPAPVSVPDEVTTEDCPAFVKYDVTDVDEAWSRGWNACRAAMLQGADGNSPVIPDGWVACSELMPEQFKAILAFNEYGEVWSGAYDRYWNFYCDNLLVEHVTHWMPLPAAPQKEVK
ncbi:DUF551 domain-containing protein [Enterobacter cloacae]|uniref:DUF551 domain-containing protein n=1 Tax=Enterobacter cloacae TaxID=550 RepID=UPI00288541CD|nr:DUF551 domain-containing protein [Enterobacter cloacae]MDT0535832.1 DUF551 domain-containing protein [Enterobacter cloacae]